MPASRRKESELSIRSEDENTSSLFHFTSKVRSMKHGIASRKLTPLEKKYLLAAEHGDIPTVTRYVLPPLSEHF